MDLLGVVNVSVTAEAVASHMSCDNEIVSVPERGRIDVVTRPLIVKVSSLKQDNKEFGPELITCITSVYTHMYKLNGLPPLVFSGRGN